MERSISASCAGGKARKERLVGFIGVYLYLAGSSSGLLGNLLKSEYQCETPTCIYLKALFAEGFE